MGIGSPFERAYTATYPFRTQIALPLTLYQTCECSEKTRQRAARKQLWSTAAASGQVAFAEVSLLAPLGNEALRAAIGRAPGACPITDTVLKETHT